RLRFPRGSVPDGVHAWAWLDVDADVLRARKQATHRTVDVTASQLADSTPRGNTAGDVGDEVVRAWMHVGPSDSRERVVEVTDGEAKLRRLSGQRRGVRL